MPSAPLLGTVGGFEEKHSYEDIVMVYAGLFLVAALFTYCDVLCKTAVGKRKKRLRHRYAWILLSAAMWTLCDVLARTWGKGGPWSVYAMIAIVLITPVGSRVFGLVCRDAGLAIGSAIGNATNAVATMIIGLTVFGEWRTATSLQYVGMAAATVGMMLMLFCEPHSEEEEAVEMVAAKWLTQRSAQIQLLFMPAVAYLIFGGVVAQLGLAIGSGVMNSVNLIATILLGLIHLREWDKVSWWQVVGIASAAAGVVLMLFF